MLPPRRRCRRRCVESPCCVPRERVYMVLFKFAILCVDYILYIDTHILVLLKLLTYLSVSPCLVVILITVPSYLHIVLYIQYINDEAGTILLSS